MNFLAGSFREHTKRLRFTRTFLRRGMVHCNLQILYECNFRCEICDFWKPAYREWPRLSAAQVEVISAKLNHFGPQVVSIGGGEPLLHPELVRIVEIIGQRHFPVMITNGWFMTPEIARGVWMGGAYEVSVSVDYLDPARHDAQRRMPGAHARALEALRILEAERIHPWQRVNLIAVVLDDNLEDMEPLAALSERMGITFLVTFHSDSRGTKAAPLDRAVTSRHLLDLKRRRKEFVAIRGYLENYVHAEDPEHGFRCRAGRNLCNVDSRGGLSLCIDRQDEPVGNLLQEDPRELAARLLERCEANECRSCWTSCRGPVETLMYGKRRFLNLRDYWTMTKPMALTFQGR